MKSFCRFFSMVMALIFLPIAASAGTVVTSFYPIWLIAMNLADGISDMNVVNLASPDTGCLHDYQLQMNDMKVLETADLFLVNGAGMESYLDLVFSAFPALPVSQAADNVPLLYGLDALEIGESDDDSKEANAHIWLSASNAILMARNMAEAMSSVFPSSAAIIQENLSAFTLRMEELDHELKAGLSGLRHREIITFHEAFPYFASAYGLKVVAVVNREPGETLTPSQLAELADVIIEMGLPPLFVEPQYEDLSARTLAAETGARIYTLDPIVTGPEENVPLDYYDTIMRTNLRVLCEALGN